MNNVSVQISVTSIRSRGQSGGIIFSGRADDGKSHIVMCDNRLMPDASMIDKGQQWLIAGVEFPYEYSNKGYFIKEVQIKADKAELLRPSGHNIINWIAECSDCVGIGHVKAKKLYHKFGPDLVDIIERKDLPILQTLLTEESAQLLCHAFDKHKVSNTLLWLDQVGIDRRIGMSILNHYKDESQARIEADPYILISFEANWIKVDNLARNRFGIQLDDTRRMESAIEECLYRAFKDGHTRLPAKDVRKRLTHLLGTVERAHQALSIGSDSKQFRIVNGHYQTEGMYLIESYVATRLKQMVLGNNANGQSSLFTQASGSAIPVDTVLSNYEQTHRIELSQEQREAVLTSVNSNLSLIMGGAGTGKTTVLKALYDALTTLYPATAIYQLALAGRAAQRMSQATGRESMTIAGFLIKTEPGDIPMGSVIVIDEMSMVDIILMYRLLRAIPDGVKVVLVGDPSQLPPIGPGLTLHALAGIKSIPQVELKVVKRQSAISGIPHVAADIRNHKVPVWAEYTGVPASGVSFIECGEKDINETVLRVYDELGGTGADFSVQILSTTKGREGGVNQLNSAMQFKYQNNAEPVHYFNDEYGVVRVLTENHQYLMVGDLVMFTENDYELDLRNGSMGTIIQALPITKGEDPCCICVFDGIEYALNSRRVHALTHAFVITVHKSQGSQFTRVIIPIRHSRLLDQTLIYTAITRGVDQVILIGDKQAAELAIQAPAFASNRLISLPDLL